VWERVSGVQEMRGIYDGRVEGTLHDDENLLSREPIIYESQN